MTHVTTCDVLVRNGDCTCPTRQRQADEHRLWEVLRSKQPPVPQIADMLEAARRDGAVEALRDAARMPHNGAPDLVTEHGQTFHMQSLYNEAAAPWLEYLANRIAYRQDET